MNHGLFDLQVNGFAGVDFQRPEITRADLERAAEALRRHQTTGILFTLITDTIDASSRNWSAWSVSAPSRPPC
jgi:N-acetylglucosamine-6-phosphate deacetylase